MADRIIGMRSTLFDLLQELGSKKNWGHIKNQIGMFAYLVRAIPSSAARDGVLTGLWRARQPTGHLAGAGGPPRAGAPRLPDARRPHLGRRHHQPQRPPPRRVAPRGDQERRVRRLASLEKRRRARGRRSCSLRCAGLLLGSRGVGERSWVVISRSISSVSGAKREAGRECSESERGGPRTVTFASDLGALAARIRVHAGAAGLSDPVLRSREIAEIAAAISGSGVEEPAPHTTTTLSTPERPERDRVGPPSCLQCQVCAGSRCCFCSCSCLIPAPCLP